MNEHESVKTAEPSDAEASLPELPEVEDALSAQVREAIDRRFQSAKDKRWAELERQYGALAAHPPPDGEALRARAAALAEQASLMEVAALSAPDFGLAQYLEVLEAAAVAAALGLAALLLTRSLTLADFTPENALAAFGQALAAATLAYKLLADS